MKNTYLILLLVLLGACKHKSEWPFTITILSPQNNQVFHSADTIPFVVKYTRPANYTDSLYVNTYYANVDTFPVYTPFYNYHNKTIDTIKIPAFKINKNAVEFYLNNDSVPVLIFIIQPITVPNQVFISGGSIQVLLEN